MLPKRAIPSWVWLIGLQIAIKQAMYTPSPEAQRIIDRKARRAAKRRNYPAHGVSEFLRAAG